MPGGGGVPGRHFQKLGQERCVLSAPPPAASQISIRNQGNRFVHYSRVFIWLSGLAWLHFRTTASGIGLHRRSMALNHCLTGSATIPSSCSLPANRGRTCSRSCVKAARCLFTVDLRCPATGMPRPQPYHRVVSSMKRCARFFENAMREGRRERSVRIEFRAPCDGQGPGGTTAGSQILGFLGSIAQPQRGGLP